LLQSAQLILCEPTEYQQASLPLSSKLAQNWPHCHDAH
jgi:hypothetical protein